MSKKKKRDGELLSHWSCVNSTPATVFVFLDEGLPNLIESNDETCAEIKEPVDVGKIPGYKIKVVPFPWLLRGLGIFDFQVIFYLQKLIFSDKYFIKPYLSHWSRTKFFFFTLDHNFVLDVMDGFKKYKKPHLKGIKIESECIKFKWSKSDEEVFVNIVNVGGKTRIKTANIYDQITQKLQALLPAN